MIVSRASVFAIWLVLLGLVSALHLPRAPTEVEDQLTNAQRIARGLGLKKPRRLYDATAVRPRDATTSGGVTTGTTPIAVGGDDGGGGRKRGLFSKWLKVLANGQLGTTTVQSEASQFIPPSATGGSLQWVPPLSSNGFVGGSPYPMFADPDAVAGLGALGFAPTLPPGAITDLFGSAPLSAGFAPQINGLPMIFLLDPAGSMFIAPSLAIAMAINPLLRAVVAQAVATGQDPMAVLQQAIQGLRQQLAAQAQLTNPIRLYGMSYTGSIAGYLGCLHGGNGCLQTYIGSASDPGTVFYRSAGNGADGKKLENQVDGIITTVGSNSMGQSALLYSSPGYANTGASVPSFYFPPTGSSIVTPLLYSTGGTDTWLASSSGTPLLYIAADGATPPAGTTPVCVEAVELGGSPSACAAKIAAAASATKQVNPAELYMTQLTTAAQGTTPVSGWLSAAVGQSPPTLRLANSRSVDSTFYFPKLGSPSEVYTADGTGGLALSQTYVGLWTDTDISAQIEFGSPSRTGLQTQFFSLPATSGGILAASPEWQGQATPMKFYYAPGANLIWMFQSINVARQWNPSAVEVCLESVSPGQQPAGACNQFVQADPEATLKKNPAQLWATQVSPVAQGSTALTGWMTSAECLLCGMWDTRRREVSSSGQPAGFGFHVIPAQSSASTYYFPNLGLGPQSLYTQVGSDLLTSSILPRAVSPSPYTGPATLPFAQPSFGTAVEGGWTQSYLSLSAIPGVLGASGTYNGASTTYQFFARTQDQNMVYLMDTQANALKWHSDMVQLCVEAVVPGQQPSGACQPPAVDPTLALKVNPALLYVAQVSPVTAGGTALEGFLMTTPNTDGFEVTNSVSSATTYYFPNLGSGGQPVYASVNNALLKAYTLPRAVSPSPYTGPATLPFAQPTFGDTVPQGWTSTYLSLPSIPGALSASGTYNNVQTTYQFFSRGNYNQVFLMDSLSNAQAWHPDMVQLCVEAIVPGGEPTGACRPALPPVQTTPPGTDPDFPLCPTQYAAATENYAQMGLYDNQARGISSYNIFASSPDQCIAACDNYNRQTPGLCTTIFWIPQGVNGNYPKQCLFGTGPTDPTVWQKDYVASQQGVIQFVKGTCSEWRGKVPADMLATCCNNPWNGI